MNGNTAIDSVSPGPGTYDVQVNKILSKKPNFEREERFSYQERIQKHQPNPEINGPDVNEASFVKKTFNIKIEDRIE